MNEFMYAWLHGLWLDVSCMAEWIDQFDYINIL